MATKYLAQNWIEFDYAFVKPAIPVTVPPAAPVAIDISSATSVVLYIYFPTGTTLAVTGSYSATTDKNLAIAIAKTITNEHLSSFQTNQAVQCFWEIKVILLAGSEPIWSPLQTLMIYQHLVPPA